MKQHLLLGAALLAINAFSQNRLPSQTAGILHMKKSFIPTAGVNEPQPVSPMIGAGIRPTAPTTANKQAAAPLSWDLLCGSSNVYGQLVSRERPLQYNPHVNAVSYIHRASANYTTNPVLPSNAKSGVILAEISTNWGNSWDSTAIWADATHWGRYPQGAIYSPSGNTNINNAYVVGCGVSVGANSFDGNWYASKKLGTYDNVASTAAGAQQFLSFQLSSYPPNQPPHGWSRVGFSVTDDGLVHSLGIVGDNLTGTGTMRGFAVVTGTFNNSTSTFDWKVDTLIPNTFMDPSNSKHLNADGQMAFNQSGTIGYIVGIGALTTSTLANRGYQPIIYKMDKTSNANATWTLMPGIDFNSTLMRPVVKSTFEGLTGLTPMHIINNDTVGIPYVNDFDITVDAAGKLHIGAVLMSTARENPDSLNYISQFITSVNPTERYKWRHTAGHRPYLYDFIGDGTTFDYKIVDSIASEEPSPGVGYPGYGDNPWDPSGTGSLKVGMDSRLQLGRTPDGQFITFSWAESDSGFTNNAYKWNNLPDIKVRLMAVGTGTNMYRVDHLTGSGSSAFQNITSHDNDVKSRATLHYMSPTTGSAVISPGTNSFSVDINTPFTVTNSTPYSQLTNNTTWYGKGTLSYVFNFGGNSDVGLNDLSASALAVRVYPNPARSTAVVYMVSDQNTAVDITVMNAVGQVVQSKNTQAYTGENSVKIDLNGLAEGIYLVNIKTEFASCTKKLIIEK